MENFNELGLSEKTLGAVARLGYEAPTPVQEQAIPLVLEGRDLIAAAKTGTGKTAAFSLPAMDRLGHAKGKQGPLMLVVTPTRELAQQIGEVCTAIAVSTHHRILTVVGGLSYEPQIKRLRRGVRRARRHARAPHRPHGAATPWTISHDVRRARARRGRPHARHGLLAERAARSSPSRPRERQTLLFSATIERRHPERACGTMLKDPGAQVEIARSRASTAETVEQRLVPVAQRLRRSTLLAHRASSSTRPQTRASSSARTKQPRRLRLAAALERAGLTAEAMHADRRQKEREPRPQGVPRPAQARGRWWPPTS